MFIVDIRKSIPLDVASLDFNPENINHDTQNHIIKFPLKCRDITETVAVFAYDIASRQDWFWPDISQTTVALEIDYSRSFLRFSLHIGAQPQESKIETEKPDLSPEWAEFERERSKAIQVHINNGRKEATDTYPILLTEQEMQAITETLCTKYGVF